jgi:hypothetical protein
VAIDGEIQKVTRTGDARIVIADSLLTHPLKLIVVHIQILACEVPHILFDARLILRSRRHDPRRQYQTVRIDFVSMPADTAWSLRAAGTLGGTRCHLNRGGGRFRIVVDKRQRRFKCVHQLDAPNENTFERIATRFFQSGLQGGILCCPGEPIEIQVVTGKWPNKVGSPFAMMGMKRR